MGVFWRGGVQMKRCRIPEWSVGHSENADRGSRWELKVGVTPPCRLAPRPVNWFLAAAAAIPPSEGANGREPSLAEALALLAPVSQRRTTTGGVGTAGPRVNSHDPGNL